MRLGTLLRDYGPALLPRRRDRPRFVILTTGRTGSELLVELLDSQPGIVCAGEVLREPVASVPLLLRGAANRAARQGSAWGCKVLVRQLADLQGIQDVPAFASGLHHRGWTLIGLVREDPLRQALSFLRAEGSGRWHVRDGAPDSIAIEVDPVQLVASMWMIEVWNEAVGEIMRSTSSLALSYEADLASADRHQATVEKVTGRLGMPCSPATSTLTPTAPATLRDSIRNFDEVADVLTRTRFSAWLEDPGAGPG